MSVTVQPRAGRHQLRVKHKLLPKAFFFTFPSDGEARAYGNQLQALLDRGVVPQELLASKPRGDDPVVASIIEDYQATQPVTPSDDKLLDLIAVEVLSLRVSGLTYAWAEEYVRKLKVERNIAPGTIRKRVGALARVLDWHFKKSAKDGKLGANPLRLLPDGYSAYTRVEVKEVTSKGLEAKEDKARERRLAPEEEHRVRLALAGTKRVDRERPLGVDPEFAMLFDLIVDTGVRLREGYRMRRDLVDIERGFLNVEGTNKRGGGYKLRVVPLKRELRERLKKYVKGREGRLFPSLWDGSEEDLPRASSRLSVRFGALFDYAAVSDFTEHDLRHEATCRWFEMKNPNGSWVFSDLEICRIMGWTDTKMALRYLSLRGEDLAARLLV